MAEIFTGSYLDSQERLSKGGRFMQSAANLEAWLMRATCRLSATSAAQVRSEIQEHYESARDEAIGGGATVEEADRSALASLGDASTAGRQYRKVLLTTSEDRLLRETTWEARAFCSWFRLLLPIAAAALCAGIWFLVAGKTDLALPLMIGAAGMSLLFARPLMPINTPARARVFRGARWAWLAAVVLFAVWPDPLKQSWLLVAIVWPIVWVEWTLYSVRRKLAVAQWPRPLYL
jgi:hypothetical protein